MPDFRAGGVAVPHPARGGAIFASALLALVSSVACREGPPVAAAGRGSGAAEPATHPEAEKRAVVALGRLRITDETPPARRPWTASPEFLDATLRTAFRAAGVKSDPPAETEWALTARARVVYGLAGGDGLPLEIVAAGTAALRWHVDVSIRIPGEPVPLETAFDGRGEAAFGGQVAALGPMLQGLAATALAGLTTDLAARLDVVTRSSAGLISALDEADADRRHLAIERLAMLRSRSAVPALAAHLKKEKNRGCFLRLVGALAELGDPSAADALIAVADPKDRESLTAIVDALATLGGVSVAAFFEVLADHDAPDVRSLVAQARERMKNRRTP